MRNAKLFLVPLALPFALAAQEPRTIDATVANATEGRPAVAPLSANAQLAPVEGSGAHGLSGAHAGTAKVGARQVAIVVGKSDPRIDQVDMLLVDASGDGEFGAAERMPITLTDSGRGVSASEALELGLAVGGRDINASARVVVAGQQPPRVMLQFPNYLLASTEIGGEKVRIGVVDADFDGAFGSAGDQWGVAPGEDAGVNVYGMSAMGEKPWVAGHLVSIRVDGESIALTTKASDKPDPATLASHRERVEHMWMSRFDEGAAAFAQQRGLDTSRPKTETPIDWKWVTVDEALAMAKAEGKPVFIDIMAFWCVWCYRMDHTTYCDAEVAKLMNERFIPVKIIQEQDLAGDYERIRTKLGARGIPAMGIFDGDGEVLHSISGWKKPEDFLAELQKGLK